MYVLHSRAQLSAIRIVGVSLALTAMFGCSTEDRRSLRGESKIQGQADSLGGPNAVGGRNTGKPPAGNAPGPDGGTSPPKQDAGVPPATPPPPPPAPAPGPEGSCGNPTCNGSDEIGGTCTCTGNGDVGVVAMICQGGQCVCASVENVTNFDQDTTCDSIEEMKQAFVNNCDCY